MASKEELTIATHDGGFHFDDITAMAIVQLWVEQHGYEWNAIRTRDPQILADCNIVFDVGGVFDPGRHRFDHHQPDFDQVRSNGIPYAAAGLVWRAYGPELCAGDDRVCSDIDINCIQKIDAIDNGIALSISTRDDGIGDFSIYDLLRVSEPTWREDSARLDTAFWWWVEHMRMYVQRLMVYTRDRIDAGDAVRSLIAQSADPRVLVIDRPYPWKTMGDILAPVQVIIYPSTDGTKWKAESIMDDSGNFFSRKVYFPQQWAGLRDQELSKVSGVSDAIFCHKGMHLFIAKSKESVLRAVGQIIK